MPDTPLRPLGLRPPSQKPALRLKLKPGAKDLKPRYPMNADYLVREGLSFGEYQNSLYGVCGPTSAANLVRLVTAWLDQQMSAPSQQDVFDLYRLNNPSWDPATGAGDDGVVLADMLNLWRKNGFAGRIPVAFAKITSLDDIRAAIAIFGGVLMGLNLTEAQDRQLSTGTWSYEQAAEWGGHAVMAGAYQDPNGTTNDRVGIVTWGETVQCTTEFIEHQLLEAWVVVLPDHCADSRFLQNVDIEQMATDFKALTGEDLPLGTTDRGVL